MILEESNKINSESIESGNGWTDCVFETTNQFITSEVFKSRNELVNWTREEGRKCGIVVVIRRRSVIEVVVQRGVVAHFALKGKNVGPRDEWIVEVVNGMHNHHAAKYPEGHSYMGQLTKEENNLLVNISKNLVNPKEILYTLKKNDPLNSSTMKTIYNARHIQRVIEKAGMSEMQILLNNLEKYNYVEWHRSYGTENIVSDLFWTHLDSVVVSYTYKS
ncbi:uncharacterized protein LOC133730467 [Rosa rugosa]|uniref:uncharacterized protein LOC133730467 n=1 Tax=Rosa rugosa TaxID=74645 RepID=UPI002B40AF82|nr:uncharacterized protein LOC133730467 [Rosa rugosa]